jgi:cytosine/adenosine deaminase-related metal-dependent hydrolase
MSEHRTLIRGGYVITMDDARGDLPVGDVLIEGQSIAAIAPSVDVSDARLIDARGAVVMPGLVDTHRHTWQTQMRGICADWTLNDYFVGMRLMISPAYAAEDVYLGNYLGALEAIQSGVTTLLDFSHCNNTPEHADAAVAGLEDAGVRALHCYGFFASARDSAAFPTHEARLADFERVARSHGSADALVTIGAALTEVATIPWAGTAAEIDVTRRLGARMVLHTGCQWGSVVTMGIKEMHAHRLLGPDQVHVHCNTLDDLEWKMLAGAGAKVSISPETELNMGMGHPVVGKCREHGIRPTLSCDIISLNSGDLFTQMRLALATARCSGNDTFNRAGAMPQVLTITAREALRWATLYGAEACGLDAKIGSLRPGKQADIVVIGGPDSMAFRPRVEPVGNVVFQTTARDVRDVIIAGRLVKENGTLVGVDLPRVLDRAEDSAARILATVRKSAPTFPSTPAAGISFEAFEEVARRNLSSTTSPPAARG